MNNIEVLLKVLYIRDFTGGKQLLTEALRARLVNRAVKTKPETEGDKDSLFQVMKDETEDSLGFFQADRDDFFEIYEHTKKIDLLDFALHIYRDDRTGVISAPKFLVQHIGERIAKLKPKTILITEAEKSAVGLREIISQNKEAEFTLTTENNLMETVLKLTFEKNKNVRVIFESIYADCLKDKSFDYIYSLPSFDRPSEVRGGFMVRDCDGIAIENMLKHLASGGELDLIASAKVTFLGGGFKRLRKTVMDNYGINKLFMLPEGSFRPYSAAKSYLISLSDKRPEEVELGILEEAKGKTETALHKMIKYDEFAAHEDWRIELLLADDDDDIRKFRNSELPKVKIKDIAEVFRGKSILRGDMAVGDIAVLNISDIEDGEIDYKNLKTIDDDERKIKRYELETGDVILSSRGTSIKLAVFERQEKVVIASANLMVIRAKADFLGEYIKIFLESPAGQALIKSFLRGNVVMNLNHADVMEIELPFLSIDKQKELISMYSREKEEYKQTTERASARWDEVKAQVYGKLL